ncbi:DUF3027 domain-containing protein [Arthrobacter sp. NIO-1057]|uniref:DUF3027 domain-containing protein n=1 Tax=Arthrobacter sp. NIO-1057 TaxID=993071 RepID=UPI00071C25DA|nr:DUF3027 domain-containing protein [Arthrobacter sp. NIO-1057]KSU66777.1 hypothetical protein AS038_08965 [Arthrobacter sp. NIO-1057]SCC23436.1 Protein of unknown function [Arthrobacter sp. NIO-1057]
MARKPKLDTILADAVDVARDALAEIAGAQEIGEHSGVFAEGERLVTHRFVSQKKGYQGWTWFATLARVPRAKVKDLTVCEVGIVAGEDSLLAPAWVPWADRLAKEEIEAAQAEENAESDGESENDDAQAEDSAVNEERSDSSDDAAKTAGTETEESEEAEPEAATHKSPARRQVRRRRTAQRTAARRRAAQRNRTRKEN